MGCTPTKGYVASARRMWASQNGEDLGIHISVGAKADLKSYKVIWDSVQVHPTISELIPTKLENLESEDEKRSKINQEYKAWTLLK